MVSEMGVAVYRESARFLVVWARLAGVALSAVSASKYISIDDVNVRRRH